MSRAARGLIAVVAVTAVLAGAVGPAAAGARPFRAVDLGGLSDDGVSSAFAVNDRGAVVGTAQAPDGSTHGVLWHANGTLRDLGRDIYPVDINNRGTIIGTAGVGANAYGFVLRGGNLEAVAPDLRPPVFPFELNNRGQMLLERSNPPPATSSYFFRDEHGRITPFPRNSVVNDLNNRGQVVGTTLDPTPTGSDHHGFVWQVHVGIVRDFGPATSGRLINDRGHVVKDETVFCGDPCPGGHTTDHYLVAGGRQTLIAAGDEHVPLAMNERDQVVGRYSTIGGELGATFFGRKSKLVFLARGDIGPADLVARDINERTKIVGESELAVPRATLWTRSRVDAP